MLDLVVGASHRWKGEQGGSHRWNREPPTDGKVKREPGRWREVEMGQDVTERGRTKHLSFGGR